MAGTGGLVLLGHVIGHRRMGVHEIPVLLPDLADGPLGALIVTAARIEQAIQLLLQGGRDGIHPRLP